MALPFSLSFPVVDRYSPARHPVSYRSDSLYSLGCATSGQASQLVRGNGRRVGMWSPCRSLSGPRLSSPISFPLWKSYVHSLKQLSPLKQLFKMELDVEGGMITKGSWCGIRSRCG